MAGDWMKVEHDTPDKPEIFAIATKLGFDDPDLAFAKCFKVWSWFDKHTEDGVAEIPVSYIDRIACVPGIADAMVSCGWLEVSEGKVIVPDFDIHNGETAKKRLREAQRQRKSRDKSVTDVTKKSRQNRDSAVTDVTKDCDKSVTKRREEKSKEKEEKPTEFASANSRASDEQSHTLLNHASEIREVFDHYRTHHPKAHPKPNAKQKEWVKIRQRLNEGYSVEDLKLAIDGCHQSKFHRGDNDEGTKHLSLLVIFRDASQVDKFVDIAENGELPADPNGIRSAKVGYLNRRTLLDGKP